MIDAESIDSRERGVLCAAMRNGAIRAQLTSTATPDWFVAIEHRRVFEALHRADRAGIPVDTLALYAEARKGALSIADTPIDIAWLRESWRMGDTISVESVQKVHLPELRRAYQTRALQMVAGAIAEKCETTEPSIVASWMASQIDLIMISLEVDPMQTDAQVLMDIKEISDSDSALGPLTGIAELDNTDFRLVPGRVTIVAGRPGHGKSACTRQMAITAAARGVGVVYVAAEEGKVGWQDTRIAMLTGETRFALATGKMSARGREIYSRFVNDAYERSLYIVDNVPSLTAYDVVAAVRRYKHDDPTVGVVFVDQMQSIVGWNDARRGEGRDQGPIRIVDEIVRGCKDLGVHVVLVQQLSRELEKGAKREPRASDLATTAFFEHIADSVLFVYRENYDVDEENGGDSDTTAILKFGKRRGGYKARVTVPWDGPRTRIGSWSDPVVDKIEKELRLRGESVPFGERS